MPRAITKEPAHGQCVVDSDGDVWQHQNTPAELPPSVWRLVRSKDGGPVYTAPLDWETLLANFGPVYRCGAGDAGSAAGALLYFAGLVVVAVFTLAAVSVALSAPQEPVNTDPRVGEAYLEQYRDWGVCNGRSLILGAGTRTAIVVPDARECAP